MTRPIDLYGFATDCGACAQGEVRRMIREGLGEEDLIHTLENTSYDDEQKAHILDNYRMYLKWSNDT